MTKSHFKETDPNYRKGVGIMLLNSQNFVFVGRRNDGPGEAWQMPQGGIEPGESPLHAAYRELEEEIGTSDVLMHAESKEWFKYDLPPDLALKVWGGKYVGQQQKWFLFRIIDEDRINIRTEHPEFIEWKWVHHLEALALIIDFKRDLYIKVIEEFRDYI